jgi:hypothetical protein
MIGFVTLFRGILDLQFQPSMIPVFGMLTGVIIAVAFAIAIAYVKVRHKEAERDMFARRLAYEQRMKELEVEALRLHSGEKSSVGR